MFQNNNLDHIAIILDGNKRWAKSKNLSLMKGYKKGFDKINEIANFTLKLNIPYLTLFTLSSENIKRDSVGTIYEIIYQYFKIFLDKIYKEKKISLKVIGKRNNLPLDIIKIINECEDLTKHNSQLTLFLAFNYGFTNELTDVINNIKLNNNIKNVTEKDIKKFFYLGDIPDPDLLIRTGGHNRLSNFVMYNLIYTELFFSDTLWPEFSIDEFRKIISNFHKIERKYGL